MTEREEQIETLRTCEISIEKILRRAVKKGFISQAETDEFSEKLFEQWDTKVIPGFHLDPLGEKMRTEDVRVNPYISLTEIAREKKISIPSYRYKAGCGVATQLNICGCGGRFATHNFKRVRVMI